MLPFKKILAIYAILKETKNIRHLRWMKRFLKRVRTEVIEVLGNSCPAQVTSGYGRLSAAVQTEDEVYLVMQKSGLTANIKEWDDKRDNTFMGIRTMLDALRRIGTDEQKAAAARVLERIGHHKVNTDERYEDETEKLDQLIQDLQHGSLAEDVALLGLTAQVAQLKEENDQTEHYLELRQNDRAEQTPRAMQQARNATDDAYELMVTLLNAYAVTAYVNGQSPYDTCIDRVNSDIKYFSEHVFNRPAGSDDDEDENEDENENQGGGSGDTPGGDTPGGDTPGGDTPGGDTPGGDTPGGDTPGGDNSGGGNYDDDNGME